MHSIFWNQIRDQQGRTSLKDVHTSTAGNFYKSRVNHVNPCQPGMLVKNPKTVHLQLSWYLDKDWATVTVTTVAWSRIWASHVGSTVVDPYIVTLSRFVAKTASPPILVPVMTPSGMLPPVLAMLPAGTLALNALLQNPLQSTPSSSSDEAAPQQQSEPPRNRAARSSKQLSEASPLWRGKRCGSAWWPGAQTGDGAAYALETTVLINHDNRWWLSNIQHWLIHHLALKTKWFSFGVKMCQVSFKPSTPCESDAATPSASTRLAWASCASSGHPSEHSHRLEAQQGSAPPRNLHHQTPHL